VNVNTNYRSNLHVVILALLDDGVKLYSRSNATKPVICWLCIFPHLEIIAWCCFQQSTAKCIIKIALNPSFRPELTINQIGFRNIMGSASLNNVCWPIVFIYLLFTRLHLISFIWHI